MTRMTLLAAVAAGALLPVAAPAQEMDHSMHMPAPTPAPSPSPAPTPIPTPPPAPAQTPAMQDSMPGMDHGAHSMPAMDHPMLSMTGMGSGTSRLPEADGAMQGAHWMTGDWMLMAQGYAWGVLTHQPGPRGDDMGFVSSMAMLMASRAFDDRGSGLRLNAMMSLEPLMGQRGYPSLFATGETAHGEPLVDRQHPHDLFMELSARVDVAIADKATLFLYGGPVGEPALGPSAFMHRRSARYLPLAPISHHWFDSTHITYGVVTGGVATPRFQLEASAFRGREPDENRWDIETPKLDSWSVRGTWMPSPDWAVQVSHGRLESPEAAHPGEDEARTTASVQYANGAGLSAMLAFSAKNRIPGPTLTAWLAEANWDITRHHSIFGRVENVANDELFPDHADPLHDQVFRVTKAEAGYAYRLPFGRVWEVALGGTLAAYLKPEALDDAYGNGVGATGFVKLSLGI